VKQELHLIKFRIADAETQRLATIRAYEMGPLKFVLLRGVLFWGLPMFVFYTLYGYFVIGYHKRLNFQGRDRTRSSVSLRDVHMEVACTTLSIADTHDWNKMQFTKKMAHPPYKRGYRQLPRLQL
jgi:hypothetical protein